MVGLSAVVDQSQSRDCGPLGRDSLGAQEGWRRNGVDDDKVVTQAVHFAKCEHGACSRIFPLKVDLGGSHGV